MRGDVELDVWALAGVRVAVDGDGWWGGWKCRVEKKRKERWKKD